MGTIGVGSCRIPATITLRWTWATGGVAAMTDNIRHLAAAIETRNQKFHPAATKKHTLGTGGRQNRCRWNRPCRSENHCITRRGGKEMPGPPHRLRQLLWR